MAKVGAILPVLMILFTLLGCTREQSKSPLKLTILHTNDHHGHVLNDSKNKGGMAARATLVDRIRSEARAAGRHVLLLDAGDVNSGTAVSNLLRAEPDFTAMRELGYDAMTLGNHEFDVTFSTLIEQRAWAGFPFLSANIEVPESMKDRVPWQPFILKKVEDTEIAILGLTTAETPLVAHPDKVRDFQFQSPIAVARALVPQLRERASLVIALTHMGYYPEGGAPLGVESDIDLAREVKGIDLIIGGHSHTALLEPGNHYGTPIFQAGEYGEYLGRIDLSLADGAMTVESSQLIPISTASGELEESHRVLQVLAPILAKAEQLLAASIGKLGAPGFDGSRNVVRGRACGLGSFIAESFRETLLVDVAIMNGGGIRASFEPGEVTNGQLQSVLPFDDSIAVVLLRGDELKGYLTTVIENYRLEGNGSFPHFAGIQAKMERGKVTELIIDRMPVDPTQTYHLALPDFLAKGGDKYPKLSDHKGYSKTGYTASQALKEFWGRKKQIAPQSWEKIAIESLQHL